MNLRNVKRRDVTGHTLRAALDIREEERARLMRMLQARLGQSLNLLLTQVQAYQTQTTSRPESLRTFRTIAGMVTRVVTALRDLTADLVPDDLQDLGLEPALESLGLRVERRYGLTVTLDIATLPLPLASHLPLTIYRIVQLALDNAGQHAGAGRVGVSLRHAGHHLHLVVADDGHGFHPPEPLDAWLSEGKYGFSDMLMWAGSAGGMVALSSVIGVGTQVRVDLPLSLPEPDQEAVPGRDDAAVTGLLEALTPRECDVLNGVTQGLTNKQIAVRLGISDRTVQFHLGNVLSKLGVASRTEAAVLAIHKGLVQAVKRDV